VEETVTSQSKPMTTQIDNIRTIAVDVHGVNWLNKIEADTPILVPKSLTKVTKLPEKRLKITGLTHSAQYATLNCQSVTLFFGTHAYPHRVEEKQSCDPIELWDMHYPDGEGSPLAVFKFKYRSRSQSTTS